MITIMNPLIDLHLAYLQANGWSTNTMQDRRVILTRLDRQLPDGLSAATTDQLVMWLAHTRRRDGRAWSAKTRATYWGHIAEFYRWRAARDGTADPMSGLHCPKTHRGLPRPVTDEQLRLAVARAVRPWLTVIVLAAWAGLRVSEIAALARADVTVERIVIRGKGGRFRAVPTHPDVWAEVEGLPDGPLVRWHDRPVSGQWLSRRGSAYLDRIGLPDVTMHRFRHFFGTCIQREYRDLRVTQELLGHASPDTTAGYALVTDGQCRSAVCTLPTLRSSPKVAA